MLSFLQWYHWTLIGLWSAAAVLSWTTPRGFLWLSLGAASYITSAWWHHAGLPYGTIYGAVTNFLICFLLFRTAQTRWEMGVFNAFILMLTIDFLYQTGIIRDHLTFAISLEIVNAALLVFIGTTGLLDLAWGWVHVGSNSHRSVLDRVHRALFAPRAPYPQWWKVP